jgi:hypothetical protein
MRIKGGARVGWVNATWPFATLSASSTQLAISSLFVGSYAFEPNDVVTLEVYGSIPILTRGLRIVHKRNDYPATVIFWPLRDPHRVIDDIRLAGFLPAASSPTVGKRSGMPFRWVAVIMFVFVWNGLFLLDGFVPWNEPRLPGPFVILALALVFASTVAVERSTIVQAWLLKPGRSILEVRPFVMLLQVVSGFMLIGFTVFRLIDRAG